MSERISYTAQVRALLSLGLPLIGSNLAQMGLHVTDTILLGRYGVNELAAVVVGASFFFTLFILGSGFGIAVMGMVAAAIGQGDDTSVRRDTRMGLWLSILYGLLVLPVLVFSGPILRFAGQDPRVADLAQDFLRIAGFGMIPALLVNVLRSYLAALEKTQVVLWVTVAGVLLNFAIGWLLIFGRWGLPELGVRGAATASLVTQAATFGLLAAYAARAPGSRDFHLFQRFWRADWPIFLRVLRLGAPIGLTGLSESGLFIAAAMMMGWIGTVQLAAHGIAMELTAITFMVYLGLSNAATVRVGRAFGEGDRAAMRAVGLTATVMTGCICALVILIFACFPEALISLFINRAKPDAPQILSFGVVLLYMAAVFQLFDAMQVTGLGLLRGVQDTRAPMWIAAVSYWGVGVPSSYVIAFRLGYAGPGLWFGLAIGLAAAAILLNLRFWRRDWTTV